MTEGARRAYKNLYTDLFSYHFRFANGQIRVLITIARTLPQALRASSLPDGAFWILTLKYKVLFETMYYGVPIEHLWINRSIPKVILSVFRTDGYKICTGRTIIIILEPYIFSFRQFFFIIHLHHLHHYNTNRQRKQVLCRSFRACQFSASRT